MAKTKAGPPAPPDQLLLSAARMARLFEGNLRSRGRYDPARDRAITEHEAPGQAEFEAHLRGTMGIGVVPIQDDDTCKWAALDLDQHDSDEDLPLNVVSEKIAMFKLPLIPCRSKSGGIHCYLFLEKPQSATRVRIMMNSWATKLGYPGCEIFPKQGKLVIDKNTNNRSYGNWLNMPYFAGDETRRYAVVAGKKLTLAEFLDHAEKHSVTSHELRALAIHEHPEAPPCVQKMYAQGVPTGQRNEGLYNIVVYLKKAFPDGYESKAIEANSSVFDKPLPRAEMGRTIGSASKPDCAYRCNEEPIRGLCERDVCRTRKFGVSAADLERVDTVGALPTFSDLTKYLTEPVRWEFKINGVKISNVSTDQLLDWRALRTMVAEKLTMVVPMIKGQEWERILQPLMAGCRVVETPDDASVTGIIRTRLKDFASRTDLMSRGENKDDRKALLRGLPTVVKIDGDRCVAFRGEDFVNYLKRTKSEELKGVNLWFAIKDICFHHKLRVPSGGADTNMNVWCVRVTDVLDEGRNAAEAKVFRSDL